MVSLWKWIILTPLLKLPKNGEDWGKLIVAKGIKKLAKIQNIAQSGHTANRTFYWIPSFIVKFLNQYFPALALNPRWSWRPRCWRCAISTPPPPPPLRPIRLAIVFFRKVHFWNSLHFLHLKEHNNNNNNIHLFPILLTKPKKESETIGSK